MNPGTPTDLERQALLALRKMRERLEAHEAAAREPIAIVGMACRLPGANNPQAFWELLQHGRDAVATIPPERWAQAPLMRPADGSAAVVHHAGVLAQVDQFDADFFGIPGREAALLDPQQRLVLEVVWEALEDAGIPPTRLRGSDTGVFMGTTSSDYLRVITQTLPLAALDAYVATGNTLNATAGRVSYLLGVHGPCITMDTACSSSLVAIDRACRSVREGESRLAIAGGVNLLLAPEMLVSLSRWGMLAPDGRCKTFDASANGFVRAEGCGVVLLKRLSHARTDGDRVLALIRGSAVNQDGPSSGLTVPNGTAQAAVIRAAVAAAGVAPTAVGYVEAHGTGTALGDPIEMEALASVYSPGRDPQQPLWVGAAKSNIGHLEAASGVAGLIKVVLSLRARQIPQSLHFSTPTPHIPWQRIAVRVPTALMPWPAIEGRRLAGLSAFGFSGTNVHLVLEEAPAEAQAPALPTPARPQLLAISARSAGALNALARRCAQQVAPLGEAELTAFTLAHSAGRAHYAHRLAVWGENAAEMAARLHAAADAGDAAGAMDVADAAPEADAPGSAAALNLPGVHRGRVAQPARVLFLFTGQGAQHVGMGRALAAAEPVFAEALQRCAAVMDPLLPTPLRSVMWGELGALGTAGAATEALHQTGYTQPALFAIEVAWAALWASKGLKPAAVLGHSVGEFAAAVVAGVLPLEVAARLVVERARLMQALPAGGTMAAVSASEAQVGAVLAGMGASGAAAGPSPPDGGPVPVAIAGINGSHEVVISGAAAAVDALLAQLQAQGVRHERLKVSHAFHSPLMAPLAHAFASATAAAGLAPAAASCKVYSTLSGTLAAGGGFGTAPYWQQQLQAPVRFDDALGAALEGDIDVVLELGPHPVLTGLGQRARPEAPVQWLASMRRGRDDCTTFAQALAALYVCGAVDDRSGAAGALWRARVALPPYPYQRSRYWVERVQGAGSAQGVNGAAAAMGSADRAESGEGTESAADTQDTLPLREGTAAATRAQGATRHGVHPLLGEPVSLATGDMLYRGEAGHARHASLRDHRLFGRVLWPGAASVEALLAVARRQWPDRGVELSALRLLAPLVLPNTSSVPTQAWWHAGAGNEPARVEFFAADADAKAGHVRLATASASAAPSVPDTTPSGADVAAALSRCQRKLAIDEVYAGLAERGAQFGPAFRVLREVHVAATPGVAEGVARIALDPADALGAAPADLALHPALLDGCLQLGFLAAEAAGLIGHAADARALLAPVGLDRLRWWAPAGRALRCHAQVRAGTSGATAPSLDLHLYTEQGMLLAEVLGVQLARANFASLHAAPAQSLSARAGYRIAWEALPPGPPRAPSPPRPGRWQIVAQEPSQATALADALRAAGDECLILAPDPAARPAASHSLVWLWPPTPDAATALAEAAQAVRAYAKACAAAGGAVHHRCWFVTGHAQAVRPGDTPQADAAALWGLARVAHAEYRALDITLVDLESARALGPADADATAGQGRTAAAAAADLAALLRRAPARETQLALRGDGAYTARLAPLPAFTEQRLAAPEPGQMDALVTTAYDPGAPRAGEVRIAVRAAGLNFRDVLCVLGTYPGAKDAALGGECAGVITALGEGVTRLAVGDAVLAFAPGALATAVCVPADYAIALPASWRFEQAAALPVAAMTALYALEHLAQLEAGERVLIHAAAGGVGLAAVQVALRCGATVYATAGSEAKREMLRGLGVAAAFDSRSLAFREALLAATGGAGVQVVLNSLAGDFIPASLATLARGGRFIEMGKHGPEVALALQGARPDMRHIAFDLGDEVRRSPPLAAALLGEAVRRVLAGEATLPAFEVHAMSAPHDALRAMAAGRHSGKLVLRQDLKRDAVAIGPRPGATYLITGGLGHVGLASARALVARGARHLLLLGRSAPGQANAQALAQLETLRAQGARIELAQVDVSDRAALAACLALARRTMPPLAGIVHAAGVIDDALLERQDAARFARALAPKLEGAKNLDALTADDTLDFFVVYSAGAAWLGPRGQASYAAANAALDAFAQARSASGRPTLALAWGRFAGGMAAGSDERWRAAGVGTLDEDDALAAMFELLMRSEAAAGLLPMDWARFLPTLGAGDAPRFFERVEPGARLAAAAPTAPGTTARGAGARPAGWAAELAATPAEQRRAALLRKLEAVVRRVVGIAASQAVDPRMPLRELGMDSLMTVELRNAIGSAAGLSLPTTVAFDHPTLEALTRFVLTLLPRLEPPAAAPPPTAARGPTGAAPGNAALTARAPAPARAGSAASSAPEVHAMNEEQAEEALLRELARGAP